MNNSSSQVLGGAVSAAMSEQHNICVLHIGKTGGSYLRALLRHNKRFWTHPLHLMGPRTNLTRTANKFGPDRKLAFVIRDPAERFVSAFNARQNQNRPNDEKPWTPEEAIAFRWFNNPNALGAALCSDDPGEYSAARFAMLHIGHLNETYESCFGTAQQLIADIPNVVSCIDHPRLDTKLPQVMASLGLSKYEIPEDLRREDPSEPAEKLDMDARAGLRSYWPNEFRIYNTARRISGAMYR